MRVAGGLGLATGTHSLMIFDSCGSAWISGSAMTDLRTGTAAVMPCAKYPFFPANCSFHQSRNFSEAATLGVRVYIW